VPITNVATAQALVKLQDALEEIDDVQYVFTNEEMDESISRRRAWRLNGEAELSSAFRVSSSKLEKRQPCHL